MRRGRRELLQIVCGAANARAGLKSALAIVGAKLPGDKAITAAKLRGVESRHAVLREGAGSRGRLERHSRTARRCARGRGPARLSPARRRDLRAERHARTAAMRCRCSASRAKWPRYRAAVRNAGRDARSPAPRRTLPGEVSAPAGCPKFASRVVRGIDNKAPSPAWLRERLRRAGLRAISPVVDVTIRDARARAADARVRPRQAQGGLQVRLARPASDHAARRQDRSSTDESS